MVMVNWAVRQNVDELANRMYGKKLFRPGTEREERRAR